MHARDQGLGRLETRGLALSGLALAWCLALVAVRVFRTGSPHLLFLVWNLFLACVPLASSRALTALSRRGAAGWSRYALFCIWLVFLPNAPYIVTDLVHLSRPAGVIFWYDLGTLLSCAGAGLLVGYLSLLDMQRLVEDRFGKAAGWSMAASALMLSGFGVYLGRVMRWNSWDVVINPIALFRSIAHFVLNSRLYLHTYAITLLFGVGLLLGYATLYFLAVTRVRRVPSLSSAVSARQTG
jgi:uncharacterized membrane protein